MHDPHINPHQVGVKCPDDINEQGILTAPAITLSDHRAVYDAKYERPQGGLVKCEHLRTGGMGYEKGSFFAGVLYGRPLSCSTGNKRVGCWQFYPIFQEHMICTRSVAQEMYNSHGSLCHIIDHPFGKVQSQSTDCPALCKCHQGYIMNCVKHCLHCGQ